MSVSPDQVLELLTALAAGGIITMVVGSIVNRSKTKAEAKKLAAEGEATIVNIAMKMADKLQASVTALEEKTEVMVQKNLKLEQELVELRISNINLSREIGDLKVQNDALVRTCDGLIRENTYLKVELENCIKKEA